MTKVLTDEDFSRHLDEAYQRGLRDGHFRAVNAIADELRKVWLELGDIPNCTVGDVMFRFGIASGRAMIVKEEGK